MSLFPQPSFRQIAEDALLLRFPEADDRLANRAAVAIGGAVRRLSGVQDSVPGARSLLLFFDPETITAEAVTRSCEQARQSPAEATATAARPHLRRVPVLYGGAAGPDLESLARARDLSAGQYAARHAETEYEVAFLGFAPGFAYLAGLPEDLAAPRLDTPRTRVPAGSVAVGGPYTGVYPAESPGGWRLIGRSPLRLFDPAAIPPALFSPGDRVRFDPIDAAAFERAAEQAASRDQPQAVPEEAALLRVLSPGVWTTVQGAPRAGLARWGVPPGGALDFEALAAGNALLGNPPWTAALEMSLVGPEIEWLRPTLVAIGGAAVAAELQGRAVSDGRPFPVSRGDRMRFGRLSGSSRAYLCVAGGLAGARGPRLSVRLTAGDLVGGGQPGVPGEACAAPGGAPLRPASDEPVVRVVLGPDEDRFTREGMATFLSRAYRVSAASDRRGLRLEGPVLEHAGPPDVPPEGTPLGGIQVARDGQPIVLGPDRPVTGGYSRIATVVRRDFPLVARAVAGSAIRFRAVSLAEALESRSKLPRTLPGRREA